MKIFKILALFSMVALAKCDIIEMDDTEPSSFSTIVVNPDEYTISKGETAVLDFLENDSITSEVSVKVGDPKHGVLKKDTSTYFIYEPEASFVGVDSFQYTVCNKAQHCEEGSVLIKVVDNDSTGNEAITTQAILEWTGDYEVDGCGFIIIIDGKEYKAENESFIDDAYKAGQTEVVLSFKHLGSQIEKFCGDKPDPFVFDLIEIVSIEN